ncbi:unnamed protein product [Schistosoma margrebowiei]|uniref:Uncharacterized protein n=1 Tax=Schistosoma margrebowiei TaxID=48269 RepID=A0A183N982_9TREM|nr:unnamed protein product [Schistosoma margrebowiei]
MHTHKHIRLPPSTKWLSEQFHCQLKSVLRAHENEEWHETLPLVFLGIRTSLTADIQCSAAELVYGTTLRLPGEFFTPRSRHDFDSVCKPLEQLYEGLLHVIARHEKNFKVDRHGRVEIVSIDRLKPAHVDDSALSDTLRFNARPIKPSGILKSSTDPTLGTSKTSFSRPGQQHASSALSTDKTTVSRPDQQTTPRLRPSPFGSVDFIHLWRKLDWPPTLLSTHSVDIFVSNVSHTLGLELGRYGRFWSFGSTWFRPTSAAFLVRIPYERNLQILDTNHSVMKNSCKRPGCRFTVTTGMQYDNCKGWFHEACTDLTSTAYNRLSKSDQKWVCVTCSTDAVVLLSNIIVLLTGLRNKLSVNLDNNSKNPVDKQERATDTKTGMSIGIPSMEHPSTLMMTCRGSAPSLRRRY